MTDVDIYLKVELNTTFIVACHVCVRPFFDLGIYIGPCFGFVFGFFSIQDIICKASDLFVIRAYHVLMCW